MDPNVSLVHINGTIQTNQDYTENYALTNKREYINLKKVSEFEIKSILELNSFVVNATVSVTDIISSFSNRQKRSTGKAVAKFIASCSYRVPKIEDMDAIESNITNTIKTVDPTLFQSFDNDSFLESSFELFFAEPKIIEFKPPSDNETMAKIAIMERIEKPEDLDSLYTEIVEDKSKCQGLNQWTDWNSTTDPEENDGDDYETLHDHQSNG